MVRKSRKDKRSRRINGKIKDKWSRRTRKDKRSRRQTRRQPRKTRKDKQSRRKTRGKRVGRKPRTRRS